MQEKSKMKTSKIQGKNQGKKLEIRAQKEVEGNKSVLINEHEGHPAPKIRIHFNISLKVK